MGAKAIPTRAKAGARKNAASYNSSTMVGRRRRVLNYTLRLIAEAGPDGVSMRDLSTRAAVAERTLYSVFGSKENVITSAVLQYFSNFQGRTILLLPSETLPGMLESLVKVHSRNTALRPFTAAIMAVHDAPSSSEPIRQRIRHASDNWLSGIGDRLTGAGALAPGVTAESFAHLTTTMIYAIVSEWCRGHIRDDQVVDRVCEVFLSQLATAATSEIAEEAAHWLADVRQQNPRWIRLREAAYATPEELQVIANMLSAPQ